MQRQQDMLFSTSSCWARAESRWLDLTGRLADWLTNPTNRNRRFTGWSDFALLSLGETMMECMECGGRGAEASMMLSKNIHHHHHTPQRYHTPPFLIFPVPYSTVDTSKLQLILPYAPLPRPLLVENGGSRGGWKEAGSLEKKKKRKGEKEKRRRKRRREKRHAEEERMDGWMVGWLVSSSSSAVQYSTVQYSTLACSSVL